MKELLHKLMVLFLKVVGSIIIIFGMYLGWVWYDVRKLNKFCDSISLDMKVGELEGVAEEYGIESRYLKMRGLKTNSGHPYFIIPAASTVGETVCIIRHDGKVVISADIRN